MSISERLTSLACALPQRTLDEPDCLHVLTFPKVPHLHCPLWLPCVISSPSIPSAWAHHPSLLPSEGLLSLQAGSPSPLLSLRMGRGPLLSLHACVPLAPWTPNAAPVTSPLYKCSSLPSPRTLITIIAPNSHTRKVIPAWVVGNFKIHLSRGSLTMNPSVSGTRILPSTPSPTSATHSHCHVLDLITRHQQCSPVHLVTTTLDPSSLFSLHPTPKVLPPHCLHLLSSGPCCLPRFPINLLSQLNLQVHHHSGICLHPTCLSLLTW